MRMRVQQPLPFLASALLLFSSVYRSVGCGKTVGNQLVGCNLRYSDGQVACTGYNWRHLAGDPSTSDSLRFPPDAPNVLSGFSGTPIDISLGSSHACVLTHSGTVECWGDNEYGQLGDGALGVHRAAPSPVSGITNAVKVLCGTQHSCAQLADGTLRCWGRNNYYQVSSSENQTYDVPYTRVTDVLDFHTAHNTVCIITSNDGGSVSCWGMNNHFEAGAAGTSPVLNPTQVSGLPSSGFEEVQVNVHTACARHSHGSLWCWGQDFYGQLSLNGTATRQRLGPVDMTSIIGKDFDAFVVSDRSLHILSSDGTLIGAGYNGEGAFGDLSQSTYPEMVPAGWGQLPDASVGEMWPVKINGPQCVRMKDGKAFCWGSNLYDQFTNAAGTGHWIEPHEIGAFQCVMPSSTSRPTRSPTAPIAVPTDAPTNAPTNAPTTLAPTNALTNAPTNAPTTLAPTNAPTIAPTNAPTTLAPTNSPTTLAPTNAPTIAPTNAQVECGVFSIGYFTWCKTNGESAGVQCAGRNFFGLLGSGVADDAYVSPDSPVTISGFSGAVQELIHGTYHTCAIIVGGSVQCWGRNDKNQLGNSAYTSFSYSTPVTVEGVSNVVDIDCGILHCCALTSSGAVQCWGYNTAGQLGSGDTSTQTSPVTPFSSGIVKISLSDYTTYALSDTGILYCFGSNTNYLCGLNGAGSSVVTPTAVPNLRTDITEVRTGLRDTCVQYEIDNALWCWGNNYDGNVLLDGNTTFTSQVLPTDVSSAVDVTAMTSFHLAKFVTYIVYENNTVYAAGKNSKGEFGNPNLSAGTTYRKLTETHFGQLSNAIVSVDTYASTTCVMDDQGVVSCAGFQSSSKMLDGTTSNILTPTQVTTVQCHDVTDTPTNAPTNAPTDAPTLAPTDAPTASPTLAPTNTPTLAPTLSPTGAPTNAPTQLPTAAPTLSPTDVPTSAPTMAPTLAPTDAPTLSPTETPTQLPTAAPTLSPTDVPTSAPTMSPTLSPTQLPTAAPTLSPTETPTQLPTAAPTLSPTDVPTSAPTMAPTLSPTQLPTAAPTLSPTSAPTDAPTQVPFKAPTLSPTDAPTSAPSAAPTSQPTPAPSPAPTSSPTNSPTDLPTRSPTPGPTDAPTLLPTTSPTDTPSAAPTSMPSASPTKGPTDSPTNIPTASPTAMPSASPTKDPTETPTSSTTHAPTSEPTPQPTTAAYPSQTLGACAGGKLVASSVYYVAVACPPSSESEDSPYVEMFHFRIDPGIWGSSKVFLKQEDGGGGGLGVPVLDTVSAGSPGAFGSMAAMTNNHLALVAGTSQGGAMTVLYFYERVGDTDLWLFANFQEIDMVNITSLSAGVVGDFSHFVAASSHGQGVDAPWISFISGVYSEEVPTVASVNLSAYTSGICKFTSLAPLSPSLSLSLHASLVACTSGEGGAEEVENQLFTVKMSGNGSATIEERTEVSGSVEAVVWDQNENESENALAVPNPIQVISYESGSIHLYEGENWNQVGTIGVPTESDYLVAADQESLLFAATSPRFPCLLYRNSSAGGLGQHWTFDRVLLSSEEGERHGSASIVGGGAWAVVSLFSDDASFPSLKLHFVQIGTPTPAPTPAPTTPTPGGDDAGGLGLSEPSDVGRGAVCEQDEDCQLNLVCALERGQCTTPSVECSDHGDCFDTRLESYLPECDFEQRRCQNIRTSACSSRASCVSEARAVESAINTQSLAILVGDGESEADVRDAVEQVVNATRAALAGNEQGVHVRVNAFDSVFLALNETNDNDNGTRRRALLSESTAITPAQLSVAMAKVICGPTFSSLCVVDVVRDGGDGSSSGSGSGGQTNFTCDIYYSLDSDAYEEMLSLDEGVGVEDPDFIPLLASELGIDASSFLAVSDGGEPARLEVVLRSVDVAITEQSEARDNGEEEEGGGSFTGLVQDVTTSIQAIVALNPEEFEPIPNDQCPAEKTCSFNGACDPSTGACSCYSGFRGLLCSKYVDTGAGGADPSVAVASLQNAGHLLEAKVSGVAALDLFKPIYLFKGDFEGYQGGGVCPQPTHTSSSTWPLVRAHVMNATTTSDDGICDLFPGPDSSLHLCCFVQKFGFLPMYTYSEDVAGDGKAHGESFARAFYTLDSGGNSKVNQPTGYYSATCSYYDEATHQHCCDNDLYAPYPDMSSYRDSCCDLQHYAWCPTQAPTAQPTTQPTTKQPTSEPTTREPTTQEPATEAPVDTSPMKDEEKERGNSSTPVIALAVGIPAAVLVAMCALWCMCFRGAGAGSTSSTSAQVLHPEYSIQNYF